MKTKAVLFSKSHCQQLNRQLCEAKIKVDNEKIKSNKEAIGWLRVWLDSQLKLSAHINEKIRRVHIAEIQIKRLN